MASRLRRGEIGGALSAANLESLTNASAAWLMDEASSDVIDEIASLTLTQRGSAGTYRVGPDPSWGFGLTGHPSAHSGFSITGAHPAVDFAADNGNIFVVVNTHNTASGASGEWFTTGILAGGWPGVEVFANTALTTVTLKITDSTANAATINWTSAAIIAALQSTTIHTYEINLDRAEDTAELLLDGVSEGTGSISTIVALTPDANSGVGIGRDYRPAIEVVMPHTFYFVRVTKPGASEYRYGWPTNQTTQSGVALQWIFHEASGSITDQVAGIVLTANGTPTYRVDSSSYSPVMHKSILFDATGDYFAKTTATTQANVGTTQDCVLEWVGMMNQAIASGTGSYVGIFTDTDGIGGFGGMAANVQNTGGTYQVYAHFTTDDGSITSITASGAAITAIINDSTYHKYRVTYDRDGNMQYILDGVILGSAAMTATSGKAITNNGIRLGRIDVGGDFWWRGALSEVRLTIGNATNTSGGPGEGGD